MKRRNASLRALGVRRPLPHLFIWLNSCLKRTAATFGERAKNCSIATTTTFLCAIVIA